jgi:protein-disulfide isomerase
VGVDPAGLTAQITGAAYRNRILEDAALGRSLGINHTPTVFFDGREMKEWSRVEVWKALVE